MSGYVTLDMESFYRKLSDVSFLDSINPVDELSKRGMAYPYIKTFINLLSKRVAYGVN